MRFIERVGAPVIAGKTITLQINMGYLCNLACKHCHVGAGPARTEVISREVLEKSLQALKNSDIPIVDITGGAPEMNPHFRWFLESLAGLKRQITIRTNLVILEEDRYKEMPDLYAAYKVELVGSLPGLEASKTDRQRGSGVFEKSIAALKRLNSLGYGKTGSGLRLNLVHNPTGAYMPGNQQAIEEDYHKQLLEEYGVEFNSLYCITNMPVGRFEQYLVSSGNHEDYMQSLKDAFNIKAAETLMCLSTVSVDWQGKLYDCDFNQCIGLSALLDQGDIRHFDPAKLNGREVATDEHCYGCTAGAGSSCRGNIA